MTIFYKLSIAKGEVPGHSLSCKFGQNPEIDTGTDPEDIWNGGTTYTGFPTGAAETMELFSSDAADTAAGTGARTVRLKLAQDATGAEVGDIDVPMNGATPVLVSATLLYRCARIEVLTAGSGGTNAGTITLRHTTTTANIFAVMPIGAGQTSIMCGTVPLGKTLYVDNLMMSIARASGAAGSAEATFRVRNHGGVFRAIVNTKITTSKGYVSDTMRVIPARSDYKIRIDSVSDSNTQASGEACGVLVDD